MLDNIQPYLDAGETIYVGKVDSLTASSGRNRILLKGFYMYGVTQKKCVIRWQSQDEEDKSLELDVVRDNAVDPFEVIIDDLDEGQYEFSVTTYDAKGNSSIESMIEGYVYGNLYESNLTNRKMDRLYLDENEVVILSLIHISEPTRRTPISYAVFCLKKKKKNKKQKLSHL